VPGFIQLSEAVSLALHGAAFIAANPDGPVTAKRLAEDGAVSENHLAKVLQRLVKAGLLRSIRGPRGGFVLAVPAETVTLLDVYEAVEGRIASSGCPVHRTSCPFEGCILGGLPGRFNREAADYFGNKKLSDIAVRKKNEGKIDG
jgi:Rrf2 family protein